MAILRRSTNFEVLRLLAMLMIVACHAVLHLSWYATPTPPVTALAALKGSFCYLVVQYGQVGVTLFFMISGYFLVNKPFKWSRVSKTWLQTWLYGMICLAATLLLRAFYHLPKGVERLFVGDQLPNTTIQCLFPFTWNAYWFITAYLCMLLLSPVLNAGLLNTSKRTTGALIALLVFVGLWPSLGARVGYWNGLLEGILGYCAGAWIRLHAIETRTTYSKACGALMIASTALMLIYNYLNLRQAPIALFLKWNSNVKDGLRSAPCVVAACIFLLFKGWSPSLGAKSEQLLLRSAHATFGVYLLHENIFAFRMLWPLLEKVFPTPDGLQSEFFLGIAAVLALFVILDIAAMLIDSIVVLPIQSAIRLRLNNYDHAR